MSKVALVTGAGRGLGMTIATTLAKSGFDIAICYNESASGAKLVMDKVQELGQKAIIVKCDISIEQQVVSMVNDIMKSFGRIDVLVNNSAVCIDSLFQDKTAENFRRTLDVNVVGTFLLSKYVGQIMYEQKSGKIINISSTNGINTYYPMCIDYDASKSAVISLTHNLSMQFAPYVTVNAIAPGFIATESETKDMDEEFIASESEKILLRRVGTEEEVANLVDFLASDKSSYINNEVIRIDGGMYGNY